MSNSINDQTALLADIAQDALSTARTTASRITAATPFLPDADFSFESKKPAMAPPPQFSDLFPGADSSGEQVQFLNGQVDDWLKTYFPELTGCLQSKPEQWVCNILSGENEFGLSRTVFEIVWHRARDRAYRASATEQSTLQAQFSERGFSVPPGVLLHMQNEAEQRAGNALAEVNREQQVREAEIKLDLLKFAEEQAIRLKLGIMDALRAFYIQWAQMPDKDIERSRIRSQAQASLYSALSSYYNVELGFEQLRLRAAEAKAGIGIDNNRVRTANADSGRNAAIGQSVRAFADVSASAANAGGTLFANITQGES